MNTFENHKIIPGSRPSSAFHFEYVEKEKNEVPDNQFLVSVPLDEFRSNHVADSHIHLEFGSLAASERNNGERLRKVRKISKLSKPKKWLKIPEPHNTYPGINVRFLDSCLNPVFVSFICLAVGISMFSQFLESSMKSTAGISSLYENQDVSLILLALRDHTVRSVNSTIWNLERTANFSLNTIVQASQSSRSNSTNQEKLPISRRKEILLKFSFMQSERRRMVSTADSVFIPSESAQLNMSKAFLEARQKLWIVNNLAVPIANGSSKLNDTAINSVNFHVHRKAKTWTVIFALFGIVSLIPAGILVAWNWKCLKYATYYGDITYARETFDLHEMSFKINHGLLSTASHLLSCKVNEWRGSDSSALFRARLEWCFNFCFSEFMLKILSLSTILTILSVACSSILDQDLDSLRLSVTSMNSMDSAPVKQFQDQVNDSCYSLLANLLGTLGAVYEQCALALSSQGGLHFESLSPFNSVAFEHLSLPDFAFFASKTPSYEASPHSDVFIDNWKFCQRVAKTLWIVSSVLLSCWIACGVMVCGCAMRRLSIREGILYNTSMQHNTSK